MGILAVLVLLTLSLTSCQVNWGNTSYDVPWYVMAIIISAIVIISSILSCLIIFKRSYLCPKCNKEFKPTNWYNFLWIFHFCGSRLFRCPHCKRISFCHPCYKKRNSTDTDRSTDNSKEENNK